MARAALTPPPALVHHLREGRCVLFAGSGLSAWANLPTWHRLLDRIVDATCARDRVGPSYRELKQLLADGKYLAVADYCKEQLRDRYAEILAAQLQDDQGTIPEPHRVLAQLPFAAAVTTNYDRLLERAFAESMGPTPRVHTHRDLQPLAAVLVANPFFILKAHGDIARPDTIVLTSGDYRELMYANPAFDALCSAILMTRVVLFVGYSLKDPDFRLLLERQLTTFGGSVPDRYALMTDVGPVESEVLLRSAGIHVVSYTVKRRGSPTARHAGMLKFLQALHTGVEAAASAASRAPAPPAPDRARGKRRSGKHPIPVMTAELRLRTRNGSVEVRLRSDDGPALAPPQPLDWAALAELTQAALSSHASGRDAYRRLGEHLARYLPESVLRAIPDGQAIRLDFTRDLATIPWELTLVEGKHLALRNPVSRDTVGVADEARGYPAVSLPPRVLLIGDPTRDLPLPGARAEVQEIARMYQRAGVECTTLVGARRATFAAVVGELRNGDYDLVHFAGHAWFDAEESYIALEHTGALLRASEMRSLLSARPPAVLVLNSHYTAFVPAGVFPESTQRRRRGAGEPGAASAVIGGGGFTGLALTTGVGAFVGCFGSPADEPARLLAVRLHEELLRGRCVTLAMHAARSATWAASGDDPTGVTYSLSGYGDLVLR